MSKMIELTPGSSKKKKQNPDYSQVLTQSSHGKFSIEDEDDEYEQDEDVEISFDSVSGTAARRNGRSDAAEGGVGSAAANDGMTCSKAFSTVGFIWSTLTFSWMQGLLQTGNKRALEMEDLYDLPYSDTGHGVYRRFRKGWTDQIASSQSPSLAIAFAHVFGKPFLAAAGLKLVHDSLLFVGPLLLNRLINFLRDPSQPLSLGLMYVLGLFLANLVMSLALRQYFWWCYRVGMNLRSSVVTAVYHKALCISVAVLSRKTLGEITNLMSVDSGRLQELTPYLHAVWYSLFQVAVALYFLFNQVGISCFAGMTVIILTIPLTGQVSSFLKTQQKALAKIRDERVKLTNEVLNGMKVIKLQAWEAEFDARIKEVRDRELRVFTRYSIAVSLSGALYTAIPLLVAIVTFAMYIGLGNELDVATALTSLALFDLLRFPLFMMPNVLNNIVEAKVSVDRVQGFLLESEKQPVHSHPLRRTGVRLRKATLVWESTVKRPEVDGGDMRTPALTLWRALVLGLGTIKTWTLEAVSCGFCAQKTRLDRDTLTRGVGSSAVNPMQQAQSQQSLSRTTSTGSLASTGSKHGGGGKDGAVDTVPLSEAEFLSIVRDAQVQEAEQYIEKLETEVQTLRKECQILSTHQKQPKQPKQAPGFVQTVEGTVGNLLGGDDDDDDLPAEGSADELRCTGPVGGYATVGESNAVGVEEGVEGREGGESGAVGGGWGNPDLDEFPDSDAELEGTDVLAVPGAGAAAGRYDSSSISQPQKQQQQSARLLTLSRINLEAKAGQLISIVGQVGSGKSSVLSSLLGDLRVCYGGVSVYGSVAYAAQVAFIQNSTLRDNIVYGNSYSESKYQSTLAECALLPDIKVLPAGHETEIGERGINLSGGQKARVGLARAVYADADIYLLDDPLSAVDAHVGQQLFEGCIMQLKRRGKCVVLVTNALQFLKQSDFIVVLKEGRVVESGSYDDLLRSKLGFTEMIATMKDTSSGSTAAGAAGASDAIAVGESNSTASGVLKLSTTSAKSTHAGAGAGTDIEEDVPHQDTQQDNAAHDPKSAADGAADADGEAADGEAADGEAADGEESVEDDSKVSLKKSAQLITQEDREVGNVSWRVYLKWAMAAGGIYVGVLIILFFYFGEMVAVISSWWLSYWSEHRSAASPWFYLGIYILINVGVVIFSLSRELYVRMRALDASKMLFEELLNAVLFSPMAFFDTTPLGRIINRFSKDIYTVDEQIPQTVRMYLQTMAKVTSTILYICVITPLFLIALLPVLFFYVVAQRYYIRTSRELSRLESTSRSPIYALFSETLDGLSTIRAYKAQKRLIEKNNRLLDNNVKSYYLNFSANCWLAVRLELAGTLIVTFAALFAVLARPTGNSDDAASSPTGSNENEQFAGLAGLSISFALSVTQSLNWTVRMASQMESQMVSVERVKTYTTMPQEAAHFKESDPPIARSSAGRIGSASMNTMANRGSGLELDTFNGRNRYSDSDTGAGARMGVEVWPARGGIEFRQVTMRYREGLPLVLRGLTLSVAPREKVGIVGRTGAGKSTLLTALLRLVELESGQIIIDGLDISRVGLNTLRSIMAVIPQDPVLFSGTIRSNLDPFNKFTDTEIWESLERTVLSKSIESLDDEVSENGGNFSVGQRQLLCIARALLLRARIIIMDEATAAVDVETDAQIQQTIRTEFAHATCLTVAHRLNTIMDSDKVLVMDQGRAAEYDSPEHLLSNDKSMFYSLVSNWENSK